MIHYVARDWWEPIWPSRSPNHIASHPALATTPLPQNRPFAKYIGICVNRFKRCASDTVASGFKFFVSQLDATTLLQQRSVCVCRPISQPYSPIFLGRKIAWIPFQDTVKHTFLRTFVSTPGLPAARLNLGLFSNGNIVFFAQKMIRLNFFGIFT